MKGVSKPYNGCWEGKYIREWGEMRECWKENARVVCTPLFAFGFRYARAEHCRVVFRGPLVSCHAAFSLLSQLITVPLCNIPTITNHRSLYIMGMIIFYCYHTLLTTNNSISLQT